MTTKLVKILVAILVLGVSIGLGTEPSVARGGGGVSFGGFSGGSHFSGFSGGNYFRRSGGGQLAPSHLSTTPTGGTHVHSFNSGRVGTSHVGAAGTVAGHTAWNHWGNPYWKTGWNGGWGGWVGPVFWPYFYGDLLAFVLWPYAYYYYPFWFDPFWAYGDIFLWDAIFWPGPYPYYA